jgi:hypothetical protein
VSEPNTKSIALKIDETLHERIMTKCERDEVSMSQFVRVALKWACDEDDNPQLATPAPTSIEPHIPEVIKNAMPRRIGSRMVMPGGREFASDGLPR